MFLWSHYGKNVTSLAPEKSKGKGSCPENVPWSAFMCGIVSAPNWEGEEGMDSTVCGVVKLQIQDCNGPEVVFQLHYAVKPSICFSLSLTTGVTLLERYFCSGAIQE